MELAVAAVREEDRLPPSSTSLPSPCDEPVTAQVDQFLARAPLDDITETTQLSQTLVTDSLDNVQEAAQEKVVPEAALTTYEPEVAQVPRSATTCVDALAAEQAEDVSEGSRPGPASHTQVVDAREAAQSLNVAEVLQMGAVNDAARAASAPEMSLVAGSQAESQVALTRGFLDLFCI